MSTKRSKELIQWKGWGGGGFPPPGVVEAAAGGVAVVQVGCDSTTSCPPKRPSKAPITINSKDEDAWLICKHKVLSSLPTSAKIRHNNAFAKLMANRRTKVIAMAVNLGKHRITSVRSRVLHQFMHTRCQTIFITPPLQPEVTGASTREGRSGSASTRLGPPGLEPSNQDGFILCKPFINLANKAVTLRVSVPPRHRPALARRAGLCRACSIEMPGSTSWPPWASATLLTVSRMSHGGQSAETTPALASPCALPPKCPEPPLDLSPSGGETLSLPDDLLEDIFQFPARSF